MAPNRGVEVKKSQADILQRLKSTGEYLRSSTSSLLIEMKILNKLIYKSKNTHSKEKFFKRLEQINKCLNRWKLLNLNKKVLTASKSDCEAEMLSDIINEVMHGGQLAIKIMIFCQDTVQYSLAYLSRGFFVTLHVTLISLASRIWVLQKDCWVGLVECYQLLQSLLQATEKHLNFHKFPKCLSTWLSDDVKNLLNPRSSFVNHLSSFGNSTNSILQRFFQDKNDNKIPFMSTDLDNHDEVDLGEPVEDARKLSLEDNDHYATPKLTNKNTVSDLRTNLTLIFDWEHDACKSYRENENPMTERNTKTGNETRNRTWNEVHSRKTRCKQDQIRKPKRNLVRRRQRKSLHCSQNMTFIKKITCRDTLRSLLTTKNFAEFSVKRLLALLKLLRFTLVSEELPGYRKVVKRIQRLLKRELRKRGHHKNRRKTSENCYARITDTNEDSDAPGISGKRFEKLRMCYDATNDERRVRRKERLLDQTFMDCGRNDSFRQTGQDGLKDCLFFNEKLRDRNTENQKIKQDEIDDIFRSLDL